MDEKRVEESVKAILEEVGVKKNTETYKNTPKRVRRMYQEFFNRKTPRITLFKNTKYKDIITLKDIQFYSLCAHHLLPFFGSASIAYIPGKKIVGLSKIPRIVKHFSSKPQVQEEMTANIADYIFKNINARGVMVVVKARHLCMEMRGIKTHNVETTTSAIRGIFETKPSTKEEALKLIMG